MKRSSVWFLIAALFFSFCAVCEDEEVEKHPPLNILVISSFHLPHKWTSEVNTQLEFGIKKYTPYIEYLGLNTVRGRERNYRKKFKAYLSFIREKRYDVVVALLDDAIELVIENLDAIPKDVQIVLCGYLPKNPELLKKHPNLTGLNIAFNVEETLEKGLKILPGTREVLVVTDDLDSGIEAHKRLLKYAQHFKQCKLTLFNGKGHSTWDMIRKINGLPEKSFVIFAPWRNYSKDGFSSLLEVGNQILKSGHPYFVLTDVLFNNGALGGVISHGTHAGKIMAELVTAVADKKSAVGIPLRFDSCMFSLDMKVFNQHGLKQSLIPPGTKLFNEPGPVWEVYPKLCVGIIFSFIFMVLISILLMIYHRRFSNLTEESNKRQLRFIRELTTHKVNKEILQNGLLRILADEETPALICEEMLVKFAQSVNLDRIFFFRLTDDDYAVKTFEWCAKGVPSHKEEYSSFSLSSFPVVWEALRKEGRWEFEDVAEVRNDNGIVQLIQSAGIQSAGLYAVAKNGKPQGFIGVNFVKNKHHFSENDHIMFKALCGIIILAKEWSDRKEEIYKKANLLAMRVADEKLINTLLAKTISEENVITDVGEVLQTLKQYLNCEQVYFAKYQDNGDFIIENQLSDMHIKPLDLGSYPKVREQFLKWRNKFEKKDILIIPEIENSEYFEIFADTDCKSILCSPVHVQDKLMGVFGINFISGQYHSIRFDMSIMQSISAILSLIFQRNQRISDLNTTTSELRAVFNEIRMPMMLFNGAGQLTALNHVSHELAGTDESNFMAFPCYKLFCKLDERPDWCPVKRAIDSGKTVKHDVIFNGRQYTLTATPIFDSRGQIRSVVENGFDITEATEIRKHLENAVKAEQETNKVKNYFFATISHEIRTPLNSVIGFSELLRSENLTAEDRDEYLKSIAVASNSLLNLVNDVLDFSKLESEQMPLALQPCKISGLLAELSSLFKQRIEEKSLSLKISIPDNLPLLLFDRARVLQVLINLVGNAVKYTSAGGITITVSFNLEEPGQGVFALKVEDTGCGIPEDSLQRIFDPFYQTDVVRDAHAFKGTGLGLPISIRLIKAMGGNILVHSTLGEGSCFTVKLPHAKVAVAEDMEKSATPSKPLETRSSAERKLLVLIVDDVLMNLKVLEAMLKKYGVDSISATSGKQALALLETNTPDLVLSDLWMPEMNGAKLVEEIRKNPEWKDLPVYAVTADVEAEQNFDMSNFTGIVSKPITIDKIRKII